MIVFTIYYSVSLLFGLPSLFSPLNIRIFSSNSHFCIIFPKYFSVSFIIHAPNERSNATIQRTPSGCMDKNIISCCFCMSPNSASMTFIHFCILLPKGCELAFRDFNAQGFQRVVKVKMLLFALCAGFLSAQSPQPPSAQWIYCFSSF